MDDLQIIALYFARSERAIRETATKYGKLCFSIAQNVLQNEADAEECVNDTYLSTWNTIPPTKPNSFSAFLSKITRNLSIKKLDYNMAQKRNSSIVASFDELEKILPDNRWQLDTEEQLGGVISDFLRSESEESRNVFLRKYWYFDSIADIAYRYSFSESKVKILLHRTRNRLRETLQKEGIYL